MQHKRASVASQVAPQPLILTSMSRQDSVNNSSAAARGSASSISISSLRRRSDLLKHDSGISLSQAGARSDAKRVSMRRSFQSSEAAFVQEDLADYLEENWKPSSPRDSATMGPVYRLVR